MAVEGIVGGVANGPIRAESGAFRAIGAIKPPKLTTKDAPLYSEVVIKAGVEGIVILEAEIDEQSNVIRTHVLWSTSSP